MRHLFTFLISGLLAGCIFIQSGAAQSLAVSVIPENLRRGANSVVRNDVTIYTVVSDNKMAINKSISLTVLNEKALDQAHLTLFYGPGEKLNIKTAIIYNAAGIKEKTIRQIDIRDYSTSVNATLFTDTRVKHYTVVPIHYPFTVVYEYEITYNRLYGFRTYSPYISDNQSVEFASFHLVNEKNIPLNVKALNVSKDVELIPTPGNRTWIFNNLPPFIEEPLMPSINEYLPLIYVSPEIIQYDKYKGTADSWGNYGKWLAALSDGRQTLASPTFASLNQMVLKAGSKREKVKILYKYLQSRTHYINISMGIGGLQPHPASDVDELGYGDCKDLSNYMVAILKAVDIDAYYTVVNSGEGEYNFNKDQPGHQFDHAIVCVPSATDTIWLECTSQIMPFGYIGNFTDNRNVLMIKDDSGILVKTPEYKIDDNYINSTINIDHSEDGTAATGTISFSGLLMDEVVHFANQNRDDQLKWINKNLEMDDFSLISHHFEIKEEPTPSIDLTIDLALRSFYTGNNGRLFASLNINNKIDVPTRVRNRKQTLYIPFSYQTHDTIVVNLPAGYQPEQLPESNVADERFGEYSMKSALNGNTIICVRSFRIFKGHHAPELYSAFYEFMQKSAIADSRQLVLIQK